jgi:poly(hydroxyalkanoate) depolymerase family esterase
MKIRFLLIAAAVVFHGAYAHSGSLTGTGAVEAYRLAKAAYHGSQARDYKVYVPRSYDRTKPVPLVFALHGCNMDHTDAINNWNWDLAADVHNFIVVFPFVTDFVEQRNQNCWGYWFSDHTHEGKGEVEDLHRMALEVEANYTIDPERRYIIGLSSGGGMAEAAAIAYNEYWAAGASAAGLPYDDWASSVLLEILRSLQDHVNAMQAELDDPRIIPFMVINSVNDETVRLKSAQLIRDAHLSVFRGDANSATAQDCSAEAIACTHTRYTTGEGKTVVETVFYDGAVSGTQCGPLGCGHYYGGEDDDPDAWAYGTGPSTTRIAWEFFSRHTFSGNIRPEITAHSNVTGDDKIQVSGSAVDPDGTIAAVELVLEKRVGTAYQYFAAVPVTGVFSSFTAASQALEDGIYKVNAVATDNQGAKAESTPEIQFVNFSAHAPVVSEVAATVVQNDVTITGSVSDADNDLDRVLVGVGNKTTPAAVTGGTFAARFNGLGPGNHTAEATAHDSLEQTGADTVDFSIDYIPPPSAAGTIQKHCEAGRIPWLEYSSYYLKYGQDEFTVYQRSDGKWSDLPPGGTCLNASIAEHVSQGRAYPETSGWWFWRQTSFYAEGSKDLLGNWPDANVSLQESIPGNWQKVSSCQ